MYILLGTSEANAWFVGTFPTFELAYEMRDSLDAFQIPLARKTIKNHGSGYGLYEAVGEAMKSIDPLYQGEGTAWYKIKEVYFI